MNLHEKRNERTCATWTRRDRLAAPVATAMPRTPRARTWPPSGRSNTMEAFTCEWARWRSASARWSTRAWSLASTSNSSRTPSATTLCLPSRRPLGWRSSSYRCTLYFSTTRWVHSETIEKMIERQKILGWRCIRDLPLEHFFVSSWKCALIKACWILFNRAMTRVKACCKIELNYNKLIRFLFAVSLKNV